MQVKESALNTLEQFPIWEEESGDKGMKEKKKI